MFIHDPVMLFEFAFGLVFSLYLIFIIYKVVCEVMEEVDMAKKTKNGTVVPYAEGMKKAILENAVEEMAVTTVGDSGGYVKNNNAFIERQLKMFTPNFDAVQFNKFAISLFDRFVKTRGSENIPLISPNINPMLLPYSIACFDGFYLHNYIINDNTEKLKLYCTIQTEGDELTDSSKESYFLTFSRENPLIKLKGGQFLTVSCPNCGGEIDMDQKMVSECPYCHSTVTFAEYDWILTDVEHITPETKICNLPILKNCRF